MKLQTTAGMSKHLSFCFTPAPAQTSILLICYCKRKKFHLESFHGGELEVGVANCIFESYLSSEISVSNAKNYFNICLKTLFVLDLIVCCSLSDNSPDF